MIKFLHTADWHVGAPQHPLVYQTKMLPKLAEVAKENSVDFVLCAGDIFDKHRPKIEHMNHLLDFLVNAQDIHWIFIDGNHDISKNKQTSSLDYLKILENELPHVKTFPSGVHNVELNNKEVCLYVLPENINEAQKHISDYPIIGVWHGIFPGLNIKNLKEGKELLKSSERILIKTGCDYLSLGDIHKRLKLHPKARYPGSLVQKTFSDEQGILFVRISSEKKVAIKKLFLDLPEKITYDVVGATTKDFSIDAVIGIVKEQAKTKKSFVKLKFYLPLHIWKTIDRDYLKKELDDYVLELKLSNESPTEEMNLRNGWEILTKAQSMEEELIVLTEEVLKETDNKFNKKKVISTIRKFI
jgi:DNA repair exonuclease SbcCD nuclease subunit